MTAAPMMEVALGTFGIEAHDAGVPPESPGAVQVVALCRQKVDGVLVHPGQHYWLPRERAVANAARDIVHIPDAVHLDWWGAPGRVLSPFAADRELVLTRTETPGALRITQGCGYDPGSAVYRYHSAFNAASKHASVFTRFDDTNQHCSLRQFDGTRDAPLVRESLLTADVLHCHVNYMLAANATSQLLRAGDARSARPVQWRPGQWIIRHYHGSRPDGRTNLEHRVDDLVRARAESDGGGLIRVGARLTLCAEPGASDLEWLPIPVPVERYRALRAEVGYEPPDGRRPFRIVHSPTKRSYKGTEVFIDAVQKLRAKGLAIEPLMIENREHGATLRLKATADLCFDSFWLGIQGSGLESGAMQMPVIAGDDSVRELYRQHVGECPYTFANDLESLIGAIERLATDRTFFDAEARRVAGYVEQYHDYAAVARRYEAMLARHMNRPDAITDADELKLFTAHRYAKVVDHFDIPPSVVADQPLGTSEAVPADQQESRSETAVGETGTARTPAQPVDSRELDVPVATGGKRRRNR